MKRPLACQNIAQSSPNTPKRSTKDLQDSLQEAQSGPKVLPRCSKSPPMEAKGSAREPKGSTKRAQREPKGSPKTPQNHPSCISWGHIVIYGRFRLSKYRFFVNGNPTCGLSSLDCPGRGLSNGAGFFLRKFGLALCSGRILV